MTDHPALIPTSVGPMGAIVSVPSGRSPRGALLLLPGDGRPGRSGINSVWTLLARRLAAELGLVVLRFDYVGEGEGSTIPRDVVPGNDDRHQVDFLVIPELAQWLREQSGFDDLLVAGDCLGGRFAIELAGRDPQIAGVFVSVPYVRSSFVELAQRRRPAGRARRLLGRIDPNDFHADVLAALPRMLERGPVWILTGEGDGDEAQQLQRLVSGGPRRAEVEVVPSIAVHPVSSPEAQAEVTGRLLRRLRRALDERDGSRP